MLRRQVPVSAVTKCCFGDTVKLEGPGARLDEGDASPDRGPGGVGWHRVGLAAPAGSSPEEGTAGARSLCPEPARLTRDQQGQPDQAGGQMAVEGQREAGWHRPPGLRVHQASELGRV